jgi:hypothetical protein
MNSSARASHGRFGVFHGMVAEVHVHHGDAQRRELLDVAGVVRGALGLDVEQDHVGLLRNGLLYVEGAFLEAAKGGDVCNGRKFPCVGRVGIGVRLDQVLAPAHDALDRVVRIERRHQVQLPAFAQDHALRGHADLHLAAQQVLHRDALGLRWQSSGCSAVCAATWIEEEDARGHDTDGYESQERNAPAAINCHHIASLWFEKWGVEKWGRCLRARPAFRCGPGLHGLRAAAPG